MHHLDDGKRQATPKAKFSVEIIENVSGGNDLHLTFDVCLRLDRGLDGGWEVKWSKVQEVQEVGSKDKPKDNNNNNNNFFKPKAPFNAKPKFNPKTIIVRRPKPKQPLPNGKT